MRRLITLTTIAVLVGSLSAVQAGAQSQGEVDEAAERAADAGSATQLATANYDRLRQVLGTTEFNLLQTQEGYKQANADLESAVLNAAQVIAQVEAAESEIRSGRDRADEAIAEAYMQATGLGSVFWLTDTAADASIIAGAFANARSKAEETALSLSVQRNELSALRDDYEDSQAELKLRQGQLEASATLLEGAVALLGEDVAVAFANVEATDAAYRLALDDLAEEQRRFNATRGVEGWRELVEQYFPGGLVRQALEVMRCESRGNPDATNPTSGAAGLFQFLDTTWAWASVRAGFANTSRYDPEPNVASAAWLVNYSLSIDDPRGAWAHWECQPGS